MEDKTIFSFRGIEIPDLIGRQKLINYAKSHVCKTNAEHLSFIGPKHIGKTVFLNGLSNILREEKKEYYSVVYIDLRHNSPESNDDFFRMVLLELKKKLSHLDKELSEHLNEATDRLFTEIKTFFEILADEKKRILIIFDGLDNVLSASSLTKNLWDNLRSLAKLESIVFITGSRKRLRDICNSPDSRTSDFWNIFITPKVISAYDLNDLDVVIKILAEKHIQFDPGAITEFKNWTGLHPLLTSILSITIINETPTGTTLSNSHINHIAENVFVEHQDYISEVWDILTLDEKTLLAEHIINSNTIEITSANSGIIQGLQQNGYISINSNKSTLSNRFVEKKARAEANNITNMKLAFGTSDLFRKNVKELLELRFSQSSINDVNIKNHIIGLIEDSQNTEKCVKQFRGFEQYIVGKIFDKELAQKQIPQGMVWNGNFPTTDGDRVNFLKQMQRQGLLKFVSYSTISLVDTMHHIGNFGQHKKNETVEIEFIVPYCLAAIELANKISKEIP